MAPRAASALWPFNFCQAAWRSRICYGLRDRGRGTGASDGCRSVVDGKQVVDIDDRARAFAPEGVDTVLALAGGDALGQCLDALRPNGRVAHPNGIEPAPRKRRGMTLTRYDAVAWVREFEHLNDAVQAAKLKIPIAERYSLAEAHKAHLRLKAGEVLGKIVLTVHGA